MASRPVQISLDAELLRRIDRDPEAKKRGRSAFIRSAVEMYLRARERTAIDDAIRHAFSSEAGVLADESAALLEAQEWPAD